MKGGVPLTCQELQILAGAPYARQGLHGFGTGMYLLRFTLLFVMLVCQVFVQMVGRYWQVIHTILGPFWGYRGWHLLGYLLGRCTRPEGHEGPRRLPRGTRGTDRLASLRCATVSEVVLGVRT